MASISKVYIDGIEHGLKSTLDEDQYKIVLFNSIEQYKASLSSLQPGNSCFVVDKNEIYLYQIKEDKEHPNIIQVTSVVSDQMKQLRDTFAEIKTSAAGFSSALATLSAGAVKIFPTFEILKNNYSSVGVDNSYLITLGRYNLNDGGGATYYISTDKSEADNIFTYKLGESENNVVLIHDNHLNFLQLGGKPNDKEAAAKNSAILAKVAAKGNVTLKFDTGTFYFNPVVLNGENFIIEGVGANTNLTPSDYGTVIAYKQFNEKDDKFV